MNEWSLNHIKPHLRSNLSSISKMSVICLISGVPQRFSTRSCLHSSQRGKAKMWLGYGESLFHSSCFLTEQELEARSPESQSSSALFCYLQLNLSVGKAILDYYHECDFQSPQEEKKAVGSCFQNSDEPNIIVLLPTLREGSHRLWHRFLRAELQCSAVTMARGGPATCSLDVGSTSHRL